MGKYIKKGIAYLKNQDIDIRIRMLFLMEYATLLASVIGTIAMVAFATSFLILIPNFILILFCLIGLYLTHVKRKYDLAVHMIIVGCAYLTLPAMFFTAGGNMSGMPIWFIFGVVFSCMMSKGKSRIIMPAICVVISVLCMIIGYNYPNVIIPLADEKAAFFDMFQSFIVVSVIICLSIIAYLSSYDNQRRQIEEKSAELKRVMNIDVLTGISNRRAYYEDSDKYKNYEGKNNLVLVTMDLNGLKKVNDNEGHSAGDRFLMAASEVITKAFSDYGTIYRTGGDEFMALLRCDSKEAGELNNKLKAAISESDNPWTENMTIAIGVVCWKDYPDLEFTGIEKLADKKMYENKTEFYKSTGIDRRKV